MDVSHAILGQGFVHAVEQGPQQATHHSHQDKKGQVHYCPQVATLVSFWTLMRRKFWNSVKIIYYYNN